MYVEPTHWEISTAATVPQHGCRCKSLRVLLLPIQQMMTPKYCPPEVASFLLRGGRGAGTITAQESFDAWSAGVMALELLDGGQHKVWARLLLARPARESPLADGWYCSGRCPGAGGCGAS
jgi:hypothetical protein